MLGDRFLSLIETKEELSNRRILHIRSFFNNIYIFEHIKPENKDEKYLIIWYSLNINKDKLETDVEIMAGGDEQLKIFIEKFNGQGKEMFKIVFSNRNEIPVVNNFLTKIEVAADVLDDIKGQEGFD